jgi:hypothetical protein
MPSIPRSEAHNAVVIVARWSSKIFGGRSQWARSRRHDIFIIIVPGTAANARSRIRAQRFWNGNSRRAARTGDSQAILDWLQEELVAGEVQDRLDVLYDDRVDACIDAGTCDKKAGELRQQQDRLRLRLAQVQSTALPPVSQALDLIQPAPKQRKLLRLVLEATWRSGELGCRSASHFRNDLFRTTQLARAKGT